jgi:hypothetical protein
VRRDIAVGWHVDGGEIAAVSGHQSSCCREGRWRSEWGHRSAAIDTRLGEASGNAAIDGDAADRHLRTSGDPSTGS